MVVQQEAVPLRFLRRIRWPPSTTFAAIQCLRNEFPSQGLLCKSYSNRFQHKYVAFPRTMEICHDALSAGQFVLEWQPGPGLIAARYGLFDEVHPFDPISHVGVDRIHFGK